MFSLLHLDPPASTQRSLQGPVPTTQRSLQAWAAAQRLGR